MSRDSLFSSKVDSPDTEYEAVRDDSRYADHRTFLERLWERYKPYADRHFKDQIARHFHPRFWEMYLACTIMDQGRDLVPKAQGPDICVRDSDHRIWVEAVAPGGGTGPDAIKEPELQPGVVKTLKVPEETILLRLRSVIEEKHRAYLRYVNDHIVGPTDRFVVAVNGKRIPFASPDDDDFPYVIKAAQQHAAEQTQHPLAGRC